MDRRKVLSFLIALMLVVPLLAGSTGKLNQARAAQQTDVTAVSQGGFNYVDAFAKSILYYEASWCGPDAGENRLAWRGPCHIEDGADVGLDLTGGFHDAGDHVNFGLPQAYSASTLGWAYYEYKDVFEEHGQAEYMLRILKHFTDYFLKCYPDKTTFYYQLGDGTVDHSYWGPPELQDTDRPALYVATPETPASDIAGQTAAALALMSLNYADLDASYSQKCLTAAKDLYEFGKEYKGLSESGGFYGSSSYWDELTWGAIWLYIATEDESYMTDIESFLDSKGITDETGYNNSWTHCWDDVWGGVFVKLAQISDRPLYREVAEWNLNYWINDISRTPGGLTYLNSWGALRYTAAECMLALVYYETTGESKYLDFAKSQIDYILGDNPMGISYEVGFGDNYPMFPHHRAASGRLESPPANESKNDPQKHLLYGALVGGPDFNDNYEDDVDAYDHSEVAIDYNAGFVGALAGIAKYYGSGQIPEPIPGIEPDTPAYFVSAYVEEATSQYTTIKAYIHNDSLLPPKWETELSFRYFFDLSELYEAGYTVDDVTASIYYGPQNGTLSKIQAWNKDADIYYVEASWPDSKLYGKVEFQFCLASYNASVWDPSNDYSFQRIPSSAPDEMIPNIPVYLNGELIFGEEPPKDGGTIPEDPDAPPAAPKGIKATALSTSSIDIEWDKNTESNLAGYKVYRSILSNFIPGSSNFVKQVTTNSYTDTELNADTTYYYKVTAVNTNGDESQPSAQISAKTESNGGTEPSPGYTEISVPFTSDGTGEFYWKTNKLSTNPGDWGRYINSWNLDVLEINGVDYTNTWVAQHQIPPSSDGYWYIYYRASVPWAHIEIK